MTKKLVCVTGGSSFVGGHVIKQLLEKGYHVNATVRNVNDSKKTQHLKDLPHADERLHLFQADLLQKGAFDKVFEGCTGVFHVASPFNATGSRDDFVKPALEGTLNVMESASKHPSIKKVIVTSSCAAIFASFGQLPAEHIYTEADWSNVDMLEKNQKWYPLSKTLAEKAAHEYAKKPDCHFEVIAINPSYIWGPMLQPSLNLSSEVVLNYVSGKMKEIPLDFKSAVDVRDVAMAHILAFESPNAEGRYLMIADSVMDRELCNMLRQICPEYANNIPTKTATTPPDLCYGPRQPANLHFDNSKARKLGINFIGMGAMLEETINSLKEHGFLGRS